ncbi:hypothetical protein ISF_05854 [Cordyceps fumosorosea ARSEF 2679]|uniref:Uncharacterized protein n=1 Tax=Cordyceps fumosorosea (strain ARSEF 2679) TaxID=1081104 RepID=A0A167TPM1_CORFA|nr:hypothetical protein ISF_05854 [Cordyceps fumosorosea ARSEF 2679]OAA60815.1 hypothetical protein ISF_05854 [Cordyceps fumosorosea ARSEF 2679]
MPSLARILLAAAALLASAPIAAALTIPYDLPDGVYQIDWLPGGKNSIASWTYFDIPHDVNMTNTKWNGKLPLPVKHYDIHCLLEDHRMENVTVSNFTRPDDQSKAMAMLGNWCEITTYVQKDAMVFGLHNDMMWYVCNWDNMHNYQENQQRCSRREIAEASRLITSRCGEETRGELSIGLWQKTYGRSHRFGDVCNGKDTWSEN